MLDQFTLRTTAVACPADLEDLSPGSVVKLDGMVKPIYREHTGEWMSTHVPGKTVYDHVTDESHYPGQIIFRADPLQY